MATDYNNFYFTSASYKPVNNSSVYGYATMDFEDDLIQPVESTIKYTFFTGDTRSIAELELRAIYEAVKEGIVNGKDFQVVTNHYCSVKAIDKAIFLRKRKSKEKSSRKGLKGIYNDIVEMLRNSSSFKGFVVVKTKCNEDDQLKYIQAYNSKINKMTALKISTGNKLVSKAMYLKNVGKFNDGIDNLQSDKTDTSDGGFDELLKAGQICDWLDFYY